MLKKWQELLKHLLLHAVSPDSKSHHRPNGEDSCKVTKGKKQKKWNSQTHC